jgi:hypothetical protein
LPQRQRIRRRLGEPLARFLDPLTKALQRELGAALQDLRDFRRDIVALRKPFGWIVHEVLSLSFTSALHRPTLQWRSSKGRWRSIQSVHGRTRIRAARR